MTQPLQIVRALYAIQTRSLNSFPNDYDLQTLAIHRLQLQ